MQYVLDPRLRSRSRFSGVQSPDLRRKPFFSSPENDSACQATSWYICCVTEKLALRAWPRGSCTEICTEIPCGTSVPCDLCCRSETISTVCGSFHRTISGISILSPAIGKYGHAVSSLRYFPYTFFLYLEVTFVGGTTTYTYVQKVFFFFFAGV